jgi:hypothetical protein
MHVPYSLATRAEAGVSRAIKHRKARKKAIDRGAGSGLGLGQMLNGPAPAAPYASAKEPAWQLVFLRQVFTFSSQLLSSAFFLFGRVDLDCFNALKSTWQYIGNLSSAKMRRISAE